MPSSSTSKRSSRRSSVPKKPLPQGIGAIVEFTGGEDKGRKIPLIFTRTILGRKFGDILVRDLNISSTHAAVEYRGGDFFVVDLASSNGTFIDGERIREERLGEGEEVHIGESTFVLRFDPDEAEKMVATRPKEVVVSEGGLAELLEREFIHAQNLTQDSPEKFDIETPVFEKPREAPLPIIRLKVLLGPDQGKEFSFQKSQVFIGRKEADVELRDVDVSRKHALMEVQQGGQVLLRDLASTNGTFVNDRRVNNCVLLEGNRIRMGSTTLQYSSSSRSSGGRS